MANGLNRVTLIGNLGKDPELKYTPGGVAVCNFSIATTETYKNKNGEKVDKVEWHRLIAFNRLAEICGEYLHKGKQIWVEGKLQTRDWEDKDGNKRSTTEIIAGQMIMLGGNKGGDSSGQSRLQGYDGPSEPYGPPDDDIPF